MKRILAIVLSTCLLLCACGKKEVTPTWQEQYDLGVRYLSEGNYEEAIIAFTAAIEIDPKNEELYISLAEAYIGLEEFDKASETLLTASEIIGETEAILQAQKELQRLMGQDSDLSKEIGEDGLNQYGGTPFILRDAYIPYSELGETGQRFFNQVIAALSANQRDELLALAESGTVLLAEQVENTGKDYIYTTCGGYKICLEENGRGSNADAYKTYRWSVQIRPESGTGYYAKVETDELIDPGLIEDSWYYYWSESVEIVSCPCEQWQWNGTYSMEDISRDSQYIDGKDRDISSYCQIVGEMKNSLRHGTFHEISSVTYQAVDENAWTSESNGTAVFQDGLCIEIVEDGRYNFVQNGKSRYTIDGMGYGFDLTTRKMLDVLYW